MKLLTLLAKIGLAIIAVLFCLFIIFVIIAVGSAVIVPKISKAAEDTKSEKQTEIVQEVAQTEVVPEIPEVPTISEEPTYKIVTIKDYHKMGYSFREGCSTSMEVKVSPNTNKCLTKLEDYCNVNLESDEGSITDGFGKEYYEYFKEGKIDSKCNLIPDPLDKLSQDQILFKMRDIGGSPDDLWQPEWERNFKDRCKIQKEFKMYYGKLDSKNKPKFKDHELLNLDCRVKRCSDWFQEYQNAQPNQNIDMPDECKEEYADFL